MKALFLRHPLLIACSRATVFDTRGESLLHTCSAIYRTEFNTDLGVASNTDLVPGLILVLILIFLLISIVSKYLFIW